MLFADKNANGIVETPGEITQENHYYPFGLGYEGPWLMNDAVARDNKYQYNGKELNDDWGLKWNDYGARWYMADVGRWTSEDPLMEAYVPISPFAYVANNPIIFIDPDGNRIDVSDIYQKNKEGNYENPNLIKAFEFFAKSKSGQAFLSNYAKKGQIIAEIKYDKNGKYHNEGINLFYLDGDDITNKTYMGETDAEIKNGSLSIKIHLHNQTTVENSLGTTIHESLIHGTQFTEDYRDNKKLDNSNIEPGLLEYGKKKNYSTANFQHFQERKINRTLEKIGLPILKKYYEVTKQQRTDKRILNFLYDFWN